MPMVVCSIITDKKVEILTRVENLWEMEQREIEEAQTWRAVHDFKEWCIIQVYDLETVLWFFVIVPRVKHFYSRFPGVVFVIGIWYCTSFCDFVEWKAPRVDRFSGE